MQIISPPYGGLIFIVLHGIGFFDIMHNSMESLRIGQMKQILVFALFIIAFVPGVSVAGIPSVDFVDDKVSVKADDDAVVHIAGDEEISGDKTFNGTVTLANAVASTSNDGQVATTAWTNDRVAAAKGDIPVGGKDSNVFTKIWIEE